MDSVGTFQMPDITQQIWGHVNCQVDWQELPKATVGTAVCSSMGMLHASEGTCSAVPACEALSMMVPVAVGCLLHALTQHIGRITPRESVLARLSIATVVCPLCLQTEIDLPQCVVTAPCMRPIVSMPCMDVL